MDQPHISGKAVVITGGLLDDNHAKTAHGLLRASDRFEIIGVIDEKFAGQNTKDVVEGEHNPVPIAGHIDDFIKQNGKPAYAIIGMATKGGILPRELYPSIENILSNGIQIINGLHQPLSEIEIWGQHPVDDKPGLILHAIRPLR